jgi:hypothetical protein
VRQSAETDVLEWGLQGDSRTSVSSNHVFSFTFPSRRLDLTMDSIQAVLRYFKSDPADQIDQIDQISNFYLSENRGEFIPRLEKLAKSMSECGFDDNLISLVVACAGEIGNNSFDHNLGHWKDRPGLSFGWKFDEGILTLGLADRGRGIVASLRPVLGEALSQQEVLRLAFESIISGRAPERRGNGLKFVCRSLSQNSLNSLICYSGGSFYKINVCSKPVPILSDLDQDFGTLFYLQWNSK